MVIYLHLDTNQLKCELYGTSPQKSKNGTLWHLIMKHIGNFMAPHHTQL